MSCVQLTDTERTMLEEVAPVVRRLIAWKFTVAALDPDDLFQVAMVGLCSDVRRYDPSKGASWPTYAHIRAQGIIRDHLRDIRPGSRGNPQPWPLSLDEQFDNGDGTTATITDLFPVEDPAPADDRLHRLLQHLIDRLPDAQARAIRFYAGGYTLAEIGELEGVSESRICQRLTAARKTLAQWLPRATSPPSDGVLLVDRNLHQDERAAIREARRVRPGCEIVALRPRKVRNGRVVAPQGRPASDGSLGRPVWAVELRDAA